MTQPPKFLCVHGHFYQPPRENPWLEDVEVQDSAHPFHNWNDRIMFECYAPNTASRVLDERARIVDIVNNYRLISFNFGPTLLSWMERRAPEIHAKIVEADRLSAADRSGHGNALAQVYNHVIMPLASRRDKETQVRWGLRDFERRFGRKAEGMWLAETAVDAETLEVLADHGISFTVLAPSQARRVRPLSDPEGWFGVEGGRVDPSRAYKWTSPSGKSLSLFFYDEPISRGVAFEGLLNSGEAFARRLMEGFSPQRTHAQLVNIATDGESYGHHHRFGDMALAFALRRIQTEENVSLTNYGEFLERFPPEWEAEIAERTSWSCPHGVDRWSADCGCRIGKDPAWKQSWRGPLRQALDLLRDGLDAAYEKEAPLFLKDPWAARDAYVDVVLDRSAASLDRFFLAHQSRPLDAAGRTEALKLLEAQRHRLLMFTSCAWFFDEVSGIETVTVLWFAARALQLSGDRPEVPGLERRFLARLAEAKSNLPDMKDGATVYARMVTPVATGLPRLAAHEAIHGLFKDRPAGSGLYCFRVEHPERTRVSSGSNALSVGRLRVTSAITGEVLETAYAALHMGGQDVHCVLKSFPDQVRWAEVRESLLGRFSHGSLADTLALLQRAFDERVYNLHDLLLEERRRILGGLLADVIGRYDPLYRALVEDNRKLIGMMRSVDMPVPETFRLAMEYVLSKDVALYLERLPAEEASRGLVRAHEEAERFGLPLDWQSVARGLRHRLEDEAEGFRAGFSAEKARRTLDLLGLCDRLRLSMNLWRLENVFFELFRGPFKDLEGEDLRLASALGERLRLKPLVGKAALP